tara:strand:+ start:1340 stop:2041 length:702 start_codon:yes stop_codon:yes gene_type:complete
MFKNLLLILFTFISVGLKAQTVKVSESSFLYLGEGSKLTISDLSIAPSSPLVIGTNLISVSMTSVEINSQPTIEKLYIFESPIPNFQGEIAFTFSEENLNNLNASNLTFELLGEDGNWNSYTAVIDTVNNTISYIFDSPISLSNITAREFQSDPLYVERKTNDIKVFPNPSTDYLQITGSEVDEISIIGLSGREIKRTKEKRIDISDLMKSIYLIRIYDKEKTVLKTVKIIVK